MPIEFQQNVPLAPHTSLKIGGPAEYFAEISDRDELREAFAEAQRRGLAVTMLGGGTNVLIDDSGISGLVLVVRMRGISSWGNRLITDAGTPMAEFVARSVADGLTGFAWAGGLPGTVGGAVFGNAGTFGKATGDALESVEIVLPDGSLRSARRDECVF